MMPRRTEKVLSLTSGNCIRNKSPITLLYIPGALSPDMRAVVFIDLLLHLFRNFRFFWSGVKGSMVQVGIAVLV